MEKVIKIDGKDVKFKAGASFARVYKNQFGYDILTKIMPLISEIIQGIDEIYEDLDGGKDIEVSQIGEVLESVYSLELIEINNIIWSMAKVADPEIDGPIEWERQFDEFPIFDIVSELMEIFIPSLITKKKFLKPKVKTATNK